MNEAGTHYILNGESNGLQTQPLLIFHRLCEIDGEHFSAFIVEKTTQASPQGLKRKMGIKGSSTRTLILDQVQVPKKPIR
ncbi:hypothetical protein PO124_07520 [Bacillus licheniformis]|nr:hypothetical protein [Bacillus licheniformis]